MMSPHIEVEGVPAVVHRLGQAKDTLYRRRYGWSVSGMPGVAAACASTTMPST